VGETDGTPATPGTDRASGREEAVKASLVEVKKGMSTAGEKEKI
jgi:hypothetical protein